ncbi:hypothetical protein ACFT1S_35005, partial [Streptomyces rochei]
LSGPPEFNERAMEAEEAVVTVGAGLGLVPGVAVVAWLAVAAGAVVQARAGLRSAGAGSGAVRSTARR